MRILLLAITLVLISVLPGWTADVLVLQSSRDNAYSQAVRGFFSAYSGGARTLVLSDYAEVDVVRLVKEEHPDAIVAVGDVALSDCRKVRDIPVVTLLAPSVNHPKLAANVSAINIIADPGRYMGLCNSMGKSHVGVLYDPQKSGRYVHLAAQASRNAGVTLDTVEVHSPQEVQSALGRLKGKVDALWVIPDTTVVSSVNMEAFILFSISNRVPIISYLKQHLKNGATASLDVDYFDIGRQAGELCQQISKKGASSGPSLVSPRKAFLNVNQGVMRKLGIAFPGS